MEKKIYQFREEEPLFDRDKLAEHVKKELGN